MFDYSGLVVEDTAGDLEGKQLDLPAESATGGGRRGLSPGPNQTWHMTDAQGGSLTLVAPFPALIARRAARIHIARRPAASGRAQRRDARPGLPHSYGRLRRHHRPRLAGPPPWLALAAVIALPFAIGSAIVIARNITRPLSKLTVAADQMAQGTFDIDVPTDRHDEVGQLSRAFSAMATNVGETHMQMRALVANVSHDMRTPLTSILGFAQALRGGIINGEAESKHAGDVIYDEVTKLSERLNDLLLLSEIEAGQALLQREDVDLSGLVASAIERINGVEERGVTVSRELAPVLRVSADRPKLERVVENLLDNARKFTPSGGDILVRTFADGPGAGCVEVVNTVTDLDAEDLPKLFERFYRRDAARTGRSAGSGLGLPIARDLAELHGGTLDAHLADGMIVFRMTIPRADESTVSGREI